VSQPNPAQEPETPPGQTAAGGWSTEQWTYGGLHPGATSVKVAVWYDTKRERRAFKPSKGSSPVVGGVYEVEVCRTAGEVTSKKHDVRYVGRHDDDIFAARLQAEAEVARTGMALAAQERSDKRRSALDAVLEPLEKIAAGMVDPADVDALAMLVTRRLHTARHRSRS
jgi:hypothetical protein